MSKASLKEEIEITKEVINGELKITKERKKSHIMHETEPHFVKLYISDICKLNNVPKLGNAVLNELLPLMNYQNEIVLNAGIKRRIVESLKTSKASLDNSLTKLVNADMLRRIDTGIFKLNPFLFGKGSWGDIKSIRVEWNYGKEGRTISAIDIDNSEDRDVFNDEKLIKLAMNY